MNAAGTEITGFGDNNCGDVKSYNLSSGTYTFKISGNGNGTVKVYFIDAIPPPYKNSVQTETPRISNIKYYDALYNLKKSVTYNYNSFASANDSSGHEFFNEICNEEYSVGVILYRNVKETYGGESQNMGYSKYYFKTPDDYTTSGNPFYKPYYNMVSSGVLTKKEVFNQQNQLVSDENTEYVFDEIAGVSEYDMCVGRTKASWMKSSKTISKSYYDNGSSLQNMTETTFNSNNFQPSLVKETSPDGKITENKIKYASDVNNIRLINANMIAIPIQTEVKVNNNLISKAETKYDNMSYLYPSSVTGYNVQNQTQFTAASFDLYDDKGNVVQASDKAGIPVTTIWGYHQTKPIAKITGLPYSQIMNLQSTTAAISASNADADNPANEPSLLLALDNLRKDAMLKNYPVTTYTYDLLLGVTNSISPNGIKTTYLYDPAGRLIKMTDANGKTLKEYQYNYKH